MTLNNGRRMHPRRPLKRTTISAIVAKKPSSSPSLRCQPGTQSLPALTFSWFDPSTRQYAQRRTSALSVAIAPASDDGSVARAAPAPAVGPSASPASDTVGDGLRADHVINGEPRPVLIHTIISRPTLAFLGPAACFLRAHGFGCAAASIPQPWPTAQESPLATASLVKPHGRRDDLG